MQSLLDELKEMQAKLSDCDARRDKKSGGA